MTPSDEGLSTERQASIMVHGPIGQWATAAGTFDVVMGATVRFDPGGTGLVSNHSAAFGDSTVEFAWEMRAPGHLAVRYADIPDEWEVLTLAFSPVQTDIGTVTTMTEGSAGGFWFLTMPLRWVGS